MQDMRIVGNKTKRMMVRTYVFTAVKRNGEEFTYMHCLLFKQPFEIIMINTTINRKIGVLLLRLLGGLFFNNNWSNCNLLWFMQLPIQSSQIFVVGCRVAASKVISASFCSFFFLGWEVVTVLGLFICITLRKCTFQSGSCFQNSQRNSRVHCTIKRLCRNTSFWMNCFCFLGKRKREKNFKEKCVRENGFNLQS